MGRPQRRSFVLKAFKQAREVRLHRRRVVERYAVLSNNATAGLDVPPCMRVLQTAQVFRRHVRSAQFCAIALGNLVDEAHGGHVVRRIINITVSVLLSQCNIR